MKALLQRVSSASVRVEGELTGEIGQGLLVLLGVDPGDTVEIADRLLEKVLAYRVFGDVNGRMNESVSDIGGGVLLVSQFTLSADTRKGLRPSFTAAAPAQLAEQLYDYLRGQLPQRCCHYGSGRFGAHMQVSLVNDGPVTFLLEAH